MRQALELALEALEGVLDDAPKVLEASIAGGLYEVIQCRDAITAIKEALAQPEQEPMAWVNWCAATGKRSVSFECESELASQPLYTKEQS